MKRRSIEVEGLSHQAAIPVASRIGPLLVSSIIMPFDPGTRDIPDDPSGQVDNLFAHLGRILAAGGASWDDVAKVNFWVADLSSRPLIEARWVEHFPDPASRPARHTQVGVRGGAAVTCDVLAYVVDE